MKPQNYIDQASGLEMKWCIRHQQYEPKANWRIGKTGRMDESCDVAVAQWKKLTQELRALELATEAKRIERAGKFRAPKTTEQLIAEQRGFNV